MNKISKFTGNENNILKSSFQPLLDELKNHQAAMSAIIDRWEKSMPENRVETFMCVVFTEIYEAQIHSNMEIVERLIQSNRKTEMKT